MPEQAVKLPGGSANAAQRLLLLIPSTSYRAKDFIAAARRLKVEVIVASNHRQVLERFSQGRSLSLDFSSMEHDVQRILTHATQYPMAAILGTDEETTVLAAAASKALDLPHNSIQSVRTAHDKHRFRRALRDAGIRSPWFRLLSPQDDLSAVANEAQYPCVLKPLNLSGSRGVIRADDPAKFEAAANRIWAILAGLKGTPADSRENSILVEAFIPGREVALEGLLQDGKLQVLALFDKPEPLDGPYFEETIYVTPSRLPEPAQKTIEEETAAAARALGLRDGPVHSELRLNEDGPWLIELAARSIGGLCSRALNFTKGATLEELILRQALGLPITDLAPKSPAAGVMMIPIPTAGRLDAVTGLDAARAVPYIEELIISIPIGDQLVPLPEGDRYLGFIFARADAPAEVEQALHQAHQQLHHDIAPVTS